MFFLINLTITITACSCIIRYSIQRLSSRTAALIAYVVNVDFDYFSRHSEGGYELQFFHFDELLMIECAVILAFFSGEVTMPELLCPHMPFVSMELSIHTAYIR